MTLLIDNYDSFAYNLYQYVGSLDPQVQVIVMLHSRPCISSLA